MASVAVIGRSSPHLHGRLIDGTTELLMGLVHVDLLLLLELVGNWRGDLHRVVRSGERAARLDISHGPSEGVVDALHPGIAV